MRRADDERRGAHAASSERTGRTVPGPYGCDRCTKREDVYKSVEQTAVSAAYPGSLPEPGASIQGAGAMIPERRHR